MSTAFGTKVSGQLITSAWANQVGSAINALEDGNALTLAQILAKFTGTPSVGKFLDYTGAWNTPPLTNQIFSLGANQDLVYNIGPASSWVSIVRVSPPGSYAHWFRINDVDKFTIGYSPVFGYGADNWMLGGIKSNGTSQIYYDCTSAHYWRISGGNVAAIGGSGFIEGGRVSLGGIIGSSVDPGAGGLALTGKFYISTTQTPASAAATGTVGQIAWDSGFVYVCTATNTWKRAAIATW